MRRTAAEKAGPLYCIAPEILPGIKKSPSEEELCRRIS